MSDRRMTRQQLTHVMHAAGLRLDDAAVAADVASRAMREQRNTLAASARASGLSYRQIGRALNMDVSQVYRVLTQGARKSTPG